MQSIPGNHRHSATYRGGKGTSVALCFAISLILTSALPARSNAQGAGPTLPVAQDSLQKCPSTVSLEGRLVMEQWAQSGKCERPVRTRVTDRFLGYSCLEQGPENTPCRAFTPPPKSRDFDTSRVFRCVDMALTDTEAGPVIIRIREWVGSAKDCDWNKSRDVLAMELDFARGEVCTGGLCIFAARLSSIGKVRLRHLIEKALRELDMSASTASFQAPRAAGHK
jgi:hypothetical protein